MVRKAQFGLARDFVSVYGGEEYCHFHSGRRRPNRRYAILSGMRLRIGTKANRLPIKTRPNPIKPSAAQW
jgi:hypothetical protein